MEKVRSVRKEVWCNCWTYSYFAMFEGAEDSTASLSVHIYFRYLWSQRKCIPDKTANNECTRHKGTCSLTIVAGTLSEQGADTVVNGEMFADRVI